MIWRPYTVTCRGELRLKTGQPEMAEADFREAIEIAQISGQKADELRAAINLARLLKCRGDRCGAREGLAPLYSSFVEGCETADLREARSLLDEIQVEV
jgi:predicted ATPase